ncbi:MAG: excinuclease ABC subunit UvrA [Bacteroidales bacterium]|nr:excinuclease ABC subunit UvrA [Bacteroidales bacterium]
MDSIKIRGARENNLKGVSLDIPKYKVTVFTGVSGSGKSSLVLDTIAAKSRRELNDTFPTFVQQYLPKYGRPHVDSIEGLPIAIVIDQKKPQQNSRSTVGTYTDIYALMRLLFSRVGKPFVGYSDTFSFNHPAGSCPRCSGLGEIRELDIHKLVDFDKSLNDEDTIHYIAFGKGGWRWIRYAHSGLFDLDKKIKDYSPEELDLFLNSPQIRLKNPPSNWPKTAKYEGLIPRMYRSIINSEEGLLHSAVLNPMLRMGVCPDCGGTRLNEKARSCKIDGLSIADVCSMSISRLRVWVDGLADPLAADLKSAIGARLAALEEIGLGYLSLDRGVGTLSGGEAQRCKIAKYINSSLSDVLYILDEPSVGLHNRDIELMKRSVLKLRDAGNTVLLVEHHRELISIADWVVDLGPGPGAEGGRIIFEGTYPELLKSSTDTGRFLGASLPFKEHVRKSVTDTALEKSFSDSADENFSSLKNDVEKFCPTPLSKNFFPLRGASLHNLQNIDVDIPLGVFGVVAGVAGSGKSSLMECFRNAYGRDDIVYISQKSIGVSLRSTPATYMDVAGDIRKAFAKAHKLKEDNFTFNGKGGCPVCGGKGVIVSEMAFMDSIETVCEACGGLRYAPEVLEYKISPRASLGRDDSVVISSGAGGGVEKSLNIAQVMDLSVRRASEFFAGTVIEQKLKPLIDVGLQYLHLNQALSTLSGGELQRLKLASYLGEEGKIFIIDEPTDGLHTKDVRHILRLFDSLVDRGNTVWLIEHNTDVIRSADYVIELGPGAGENGGRIIYCGPPSEMPQNPASVSGPYL